MGAIHIQSQVSWLSDSWREVEKTFPHLERDGAGSADAWEGVLRVKGSCLARHHIEWRNVAGRSEILLQTDFICKVIYRLIFPRGLRRKSLNVPHEATQQQTAVNIGKCITTRHERFSSGVVLWRCQCKMRRRH
jgi:hypothetical protein